VNDIFRDRTLALAGIFQAARLTQQLAREGQSDRGALAASAGSVLALEAADTEEVFGGIGGVRRGLELLRDKLTADPGAADMEIARYVIATIQLAGTLRRNPDIIDSIQRGIETIQNQMKFFTRENDGAADVHPALAEKLAELYTRTLSTLKPRILVNGEHGHLSNPLVAAKVRTALFAGVRAAFLWQQKGGSRWQLLFSRKKIAAEAARLLGEPKRA
jgi:high frequency lysogenization protein